MLGSRIGFDRAVAGLIGIPDVQLAELDIPGRERGHQFNARVDYNLGSNNLFAVSTYFTRRNDLISDFGDTASSPSSAT